MVLGSACLLSLAHRCEAEQGGECWAAAAPWPGPSIRDITGWSFLSPPTFTAVTEQQHIWYLPLRMYRQGSGPSSQCTENSGSNLVSLSLCVDQGDSKMDPIRVLSTYLDVTSVMQEKNRLKRGRGGLTAMRVFCPHVTKGFWGYDGRMQTDSQFARGGGCLPFIASLQARILCRRKTKIVLWAFNTLYWINNFISLNGKIDHSVLTRMTAKWIHPEWFILPLGKIKLLILAIYLFLLKLTTVWSDIFYVWSINWLVD